MTASLGDLSIEDVPPLFERRRRVSGAERSAARDAWTAFRSPDPRLIVEALPRVEVLPHLAPALVRHLQQFPWRADGLSLTERLAMASLAEGPSRMRDVYRRAHHDQEEAVFMGDAAFEVHVGALAQGPRPLLVADEDGALSLDSTVSLTADGKRVLAGDVDRVALSGINRWLGGAHLEGYGPVWRWDEERRSMIFA